MYNEYFGFTEQPFENNLDLRFLYLSENHKEVLAALLYFISESKAFALVCGDVGTGKTMIIHHFLHRLPASVQPIMISSPDVEYSELLHYVARKVGVTGNSASTLELFDELKAALETADSRGQRFVLIIDEAHLQSDQSLEGVRLLSNLETQERKLLQILLVGQYELSHKLDRTEMRQLRQRININRFLPPMDLTETLAYIEHRLAVAGADFSLCFEPGCSRLIYSMTEGVPRQINLLCDHALLICQAKRLTKIDGNILRQARDALQSDRVLAPKIARSAHRFVSKLFRFGFALMFLVMAAIIVHAKFSGGGPQQMANLPEALRPHATVPRESPRPLPTVPQGGKGERFAKTSDHRLKPSAIARQQQPKRSGEAASGTGQRDGKPSNASMTGTLPSPAADTRTPAGGVRHQDMAYPLSTGIVEKDIGSASSTNQVFAVSQEHTGAVAALKSGKPAVGPERSQHRDPADGLGPEHATIRALVDEQGPNPRIVPGGAAAGDEEGRGPTGPQLTRQGAEHNSIESHSAGTGGGSVTRKSIPKNKTRVVMKGDTLMEIAMQWYPDSPKEALSAILKMNPGITDRDLIYPGQVLAMP